MIRKLLIAQTVLGIGLCGIYLLPEIYNIGQTPRDFVISEYDYSARPYLRQLSKHAKSCGLTMVFD